jgi:hypothetical protein
MTLPLVGGVAVVAVAGLAFYFLVMKKKPKTVTIGPGA